LMLACEGVGNPYHHPSLSITPLVLG
jgi:uncharacterized Zn-finger protein